MKKKTIDHQKPDGQEIETDIAESKRVEGALKKAAEEWRATFDSITDLILIQDADYRIVRVNRALADLLKTSPKDLIGRTCYEVIHGTTEPPPSCPLKKIFETKKSIEEELFEPHLGIFVHLVASPIRDAKGDVIAAVHVMKDITERKRAEEKLRESEGRYRHLFESATVGIFHSLVEGKYLLVNPALARMAGYKSPEEMVSSVKDIGSQLYADPGQRSALVKEAIQKGDWASTEGRFKHTDGRIMWGKQWVHPVYNPDGTVNYLEGFVEDITEQKLVEEALRESEAFIKAVLDNLPVGVAVNSVDPSVAFTYVNDNFAKFYRTTKEKLTDPDSFWSSVYEEPAFREQSRKRVLADCASGDPQRMYWPDIPITRKGEETSFITARNIPVPNKPLMISTVWDVTERKRAEEALRESDVRFKKLSSNVPGMIYQFLKRPDGTYCVPFTTEGIKDIFGCSPQDVREDFSPIARAILPEDLDKVVASIEVSAERMTTWQCEYRVQIPGQPVTWMFGQSTPEKLADGGIIWHGFNTDVTERKRAEEALRESEEKYRSLVEKVNDVVFNVDLNGQIVYISPVAEAITGYRVDEYTEKNLAEFIHPQDLPRAIEGFKRSLNGIKGETEFRTITKDGSYRHMRSSSNPIVKDGSVVGLMGVITDITDRKAAEEALRESEEKFRSLFQTSRDFLSISDLEGNVIDANDAARDFFGYSLDEIPRTRMHDLYANPQERQELIDAMLKSGYLQNKEIKMKKKDGEIVDALVTVNLVRDTHGNPIGFFGSARDVTEKKKMELQLLQAEKLSAVGTMISGVAHELNNPLTSIIGNAQLVARRDVPEDIKNKLNVILKESRRSSKIIGGLLAFAREHKPERKMIDINDVVTESLKLREYDLKVSNIDVRVALSEDLPETLSDPFQLQQVFINLINNARDALADHETGALAIRSYRKGDTILIEFEDNGPGIPDEFIKKVFDPFFTTKEVGKGTGLGLSMAYGIVREHGGTISVESRPGKGAKFIVTIPITKGAESTEDKVKAPARPSPGARSVLVVEDEESLRDLLSDALTEGGFIVETAPTGEHAIDLLEKRKFDAVISDIKMPGVGGKELYLYVQKHHPDIVDKIIFITGDVLSKDTQSFLQITSNRFIEKPFNVDALIAMLSEVLSV